MMMRGGQGKRKVIVLGVREREEWWTGVLKKSVRFWISLSCRARPAAIPSL